MNEKKNFNKKVFSTFSKDGHIIENVPYVGQENNIFCSFACQTMIFKYHDRCIDLDDFVFNSGVGYSLVYSKDYIKYFPISGTFLSQWPADRNFVSSLYGLKFETCIPAYNSNSISDLWSSYWEKIKNYLKNDIPVCTGVDLVSLPAAKELLHDVVWANTKKVPKFAWNFLVTAHEIVIVGYDEIKKEIYYNDPVSSTLGKREKGIYASAPIEDFATAVSKAKVGNFNPKFIINTYKKNKDPLSDNIIFEKSHIRNIQKLKGNFLNYDEKWQKYPLGIEALKTLIKDFDILQSKDKDLIHILTNQSILNRLMKIIFLLFIKRSGPLNNENLLNFYDIIHLEKKYIFNYIKEKYFDLNGLDDEILLLDLELKKWMELSKFFSHFYKEFAFLTKKEKIKKINENFISNVSDIIDFENKIIDIFD